MVYRAFNDSHLILPIFDFLSKRSIYPLLAIDSRSSKNQLEVYRKAGIEFVLMQNKGNYAESALEDLVQNISTPFYLLLDSDEIIFNLDLDEIKNIVDSNNYDVIGLNRIWIGSKTKWIRSGYKYLKSTSDLIGKDTQWRLVRKDAVSFHKKLNLHSNGFDYNQANRVITCEKNQILHLDWIINSPEDRTLKLLKYSEFDRKFLTQFLHYYVPEVNPKTHKFKSLKLDTETNSLFDKLSHVEKSDISWWQYEI